MIYFINIISVYYLGDNSSHLFSIKYTFEEVILNILYTADIFGIKTITIFCILRKHIKICHYISQQVL
jgi:hypothetical protein